MIAGTKRSFRAVLSASLVAFLLSQAPTVAAQTPVNEPDNPYSGHRGPPPGPGVLPDTPTTPDDPGQPTVPHDAMGNLYSRDKIFEVIRSRDLAKQQHLTLVAAHRGYWETFPENSWGAIQAAGKDMDFELVEADIKPVKGMEPVVFHDLVLHRVTSGTGKLIEITESDFLKLKLRDRFGNSHNQTFDIQPLSFDMLLDRYTEYLVSLEYQGGESRPGYVMALDVKGTVPDDAWVLLLKIIQKIHKKDDKVYVSTGWSNFLTNAFLIKIAAASLPEDPKVVAQLLEGLPDNLVNLCIVVQGNEEDIEKAKKYAGAKFVSTFEVVYKYRDALGLDLIRMPNIKTTMGNYLVYYDYPTGVGSSEGRCCSMRSTDTTSETLLDYRGRWGWFANRIIGDEDDPYPMFSILTIDRPDLVADYLKSIGMRNTDYIQYRK